MAKKKAAKSTGKPLVIVESPAKARTIAKFLGGEYLIEASIGHVRDLPQGAKQIPAKYKGEEWAHLGVNIDDDFDPIYVVSPGKTEQVRKLKALLKDASELFLATDEDREGEAISWHLCELLKPTVPVSRLVFHEITKEAILEALENPRQIDEDLVRAQETRRIVDRLYGYVVSPLLWRKVRPKLSAGRVQSVAVRLIVARERERMAFVASTYWDLVAELKTEAGKSFEATLVSVSDRKIPSGRDFDPATGEIKDEKLYLLDEASATDLAERLRRSSFRVKTIEDKPYTTKPYAPFTTSTMQQEANRKFRFTARRTMQAAQGLYEDGHITYMRTDSTTLSKEALTAARDVVSNMFGADYLPDEPRVYKNKVKNAQEAHEAIRPAGHPFDTPQALRAQLNDDQYKLYDLIWKRTVASQMNDARARRLTVEIQADDAVFQASGKTIDFPGYLRAYVEGSDDPSAVLADQETVLPAMNVEDSLNCEQLDGKSHTTQPPARYTEASLTRTLEDLGIGRPSTYASIIDTIQAREYAVKRGNALVPTWIAFSVAKLMELHLPNLIDYQFTARMEDDLDAISRGEAESLAYLKAFYFGNGQPGLKQQLDHKVDEVDARDISRIPICELEIDGKSEQIFARVGRYGPFIEHGGRRASIPDDVAPDELTAEKVQALLAQAAQAEEPLGVCPETGKPVFLKAGRFGPYVQRGTPDDDEKPRNASLLKGMTIEEVDLATALKLLSIPRDLGPDPKSGESVMAFNGRYGPYVKCGDETRSLPPEQSPLDVTLQQAIELLAQPKKARRGFGQAREPIKFFDESPITKEKVQLFEGRYGPYVTDGETNASLPKGTSVEDLKFDDALNLLAARAAKGGTKKKSTKKKAAKKSTKKKATKKKAAAKKTSQ